MSGKLKVKKRVSIYMGNEEKDKCGICKGSTEEEGVFYETDKGHLDLCMQCDLDLCMEMMKQLVIDAKVRRGFRE